MPTLPRSTTAGAQCTGRTAARHPAAMPPSLPTRDTPFSNTRPASPSRGETRFGRSAG
jgi:hypothetical protein